MRLSKKQFVEYAKVVVTVQSGAKVDVDAVSGATNSSVVIKKAVENALKGEMAGRSRDAEPTDL